VTKPLVVVESPTKIKTLQKVLGKDYKVAATVGHIKDLPQKEMGVDIEKGFKPKYRIIGGKQKVIKNLKASAAGENYEHTEMYPGFAEVARAEGFEQVAAVFEAIAVAEKQHEKRYNDLASNIEAGRVFKRGGKVVWRCRNCGYLHEAPEAPGFCPACAHPQAHFELLGENW